MASPPDETEPFDLESQWPEARWFRNRPEGEQKPLWIFPVLLLYTGFFFGPFVTVLAAMVALRGRIEARQAAILTGVAGTCWCLLQGMSIVYGPLWSEYALQGMRSGFNFVNGIVAYVAVRQVVAGVYSVGRKTVILSAILFALGVVAFFLTPDRLLIALGR